MKKAYTFFKREIIYRFLYKVDLYIIILIPILNIFFYYLLGKFANTFSYYDVDVDSIRFIVFSVMLFYFSWGVVNNIITSITEQKLVLMHYIETPATIYDVLIGSAMAGIVQSMLFIIIQIIILKDFMNFGISLKQAFIILLLMLISLISFIGISLIIAGLSLWIKRSSYLFDIIRLMTIILASVVYSPNILPKTLSYFIYMFPPATYMELSRKVILFGQTPSLIIITYYIITSILFLIFGIIIFSILFQKSRKTGRITKI